MMMMFIFVYCKADIYLTVVVIESTYPEHLL